MGNTLVYTIIFYMILYKKKYYKSYSTIKKIIILYRNFYNDNEKYVRALGGKK